MTISFLGKRRKWYHQMPIFLGIKNIMMPYFRVYSLYSNLRNIPKKLMVKMSIFYICLSNAECSQHQKYTTFVIRTYFLIEIFAKCTYYNLDYFWSKAHFVCVVFPSSIWAKYAMPSQAGHWSYIMFIFEARKSYLHKPKMIVEPFDDCLFLFALKRSCDFYHF